MLQKDPSEKINIIDYPKNCHLLTEYYEEYKNIKS